MDVHENELDAMLSQARQAVTDAPPPGDEAYVVYARRLGEALRRDWSGIESANARDLDRAASRGLPDAIVDRLRMGPAQLRHLVALCEDVARAVPGACAPRAERDHRGLRLTSVPKPLGVLLMVYEARPTVTAEGALIGPAVGNAVLLRGGSEMAETDQAMAAVVRPALRAAGLPEGLVTVLSDPDRRTFRALLQRPDAIDVLIPRGSPSLIEHCQRTSTIPVLASGGGVNHLYVDASADLELAAAVILDSKTAEPTACNTLELVLAHRTIADDLLQTMVAAAEAARHPIGLRTNLRVATASAAVTVTPLDPRDFGREFLEPVVGIHPVEGLDDAVAHIRAHGSQHTEGVVARDVGVTTRFVRSVDAAAVVVNGSLRLHDGPTLGLGPELSISTGRLHVRGPVGLPDLMSRSWLVDADGATRLSLSHHDDTDTDTEGVEDLAS